MDDFVFSLQNQYGLCVHNSTWILYIDKGVRWLHRACGGVLHEDDLRQAETFLLWAELVPEPFRSPQPFQRRSFREWSLGRRILAAREFSAIRTRDSTDRDVVGLIAAVNQHLGEEWCIS